ncbi:hypothetical protein [Archangium lansingense]|uniref:Outer membrane protein beta-barrel domain-containing protein n=1 Tax=Archangium lansingense TaxID=2995310 RepID=A0ABT4A0V1_9BACT|nr:hypothetical protein [Archangium lansinium]MCY1075272.1 hypothetical protein [Archangium lansinium]
MSLPALSHCRTLLLLGGWVLASGGAAAQERPPPLLRPGNVDLRVEGAASLLPLSLEAGATVDVGVLPLATGTLSLGAELSGNLCALACWVPNLFLDRDTSRWELSAVGRLGYHFTLANRNYSKVDLFGVLLGGVLEPHTTVTTPAYRFEGRGRGPVFGLGIGGNYFPSSSRLFVGGEARLRFSTGAYEFTLSRGTHEFTDDERRWVRLGLSTAFFVGVRLF